MRLILAIVAVLASQNVQADLPYWVCTDAEGQPSIQDDPCGDAPDAAPSGTIADTRAQASAQASRTAPADNSSADWRQKISELRARMRAWVRKGLDNDVLRSMLTHPLLLIAICALLALWMLVRLTRRITRAFSNWRYDRRRKAWPVPQKPSAPVKQKIEPALVAAPVRPVREPPSLGDRKGRSVAAPGETRFTAAILRKLNVEQFAEMCVRLWRMRGMRAAYDPDTQLSAHTVILLQRPAEPRKPFGIALCVANPKMALGADIVRELMALMSQRRCRYGAVMTSGEFTAEARDQVRDKKIELKGSITLMIELEGLADQQRRSLLEAVNLNAAETETEPEK